MISTLGPNLVRASAVLCLTFVTTSLAPPGVIRVGDLARYKWRAPLVNGLGVTSLEDLRGKPVLVDFWGTRCPACIGGAVPASTKLQETFGDDLQVIFVECQGASAAQAEGFSLARRWLGGRSMWTSEQPFETGATSLPYFVLIGNDGRVLLKGNPLVQPKEIERQIAEQIKNRKSAPPDAAPCVRAAWTELNTGKFAKAFATLESIAKESADQSEVLDVVLQTEKVFRARVERELQRAKWLIDNGHFEEAANRLDDLRKCAKGEDWISERCGALTKQLETPELKAEREAAVSLARLLPDFFKKGGDPATSAELLRFVEQHKGTQAAARAEHLAKLPRS